MLAITTQWFSLTYTKYPHIKVTANNYNGTTPYSDEFRSLSYDDKGFQQHYHLVKLFAEKHNLNLDHTNMRYGEIKGGYAFCFANGTA